MGRREADAPSRPSTQISIGARASPGAAQPPAMPTCMPSAALEHHREQQQRADPTTCASSGSGGDAARASNFNTTADTAIVPTQIAAPVSQRRAPHASAPRRRVAGVDRGRGCTDSGTMNISAA